MCGQLPTSQLKFLSICRVLPPKERIARDQVAIAEMQVFQVFRRRGSRGIVDRHRPNPVQTLARLRLLELPRHPPRFTGAQGPEEEKHLFGRDDPLQFGLPRLIWCEIEAGKG